MTKEYDLLFAALALKIGQVDQAQHAQACIEWFADVTQPLADIFVARGWMTEQDRLNVAALVEELIQEHQGSLYAALLAVESLQWTSPISAPEDVSVSGKTAIPGVASPAESNADHREEPGATADHPAASRTKAQSDPKEKTVIGHIIGAEHHAQLEAVEPRSHTLGRYSLTRVHGKGGLGRVWLAKDTNLKRDVALKEILPSKDSDVRRSHRLIKEAQITGQLDHPNIIPVYELGSNPASKTPFYTMKFLRGETLSKKIDEYHKHRQEGTATRLELRNLLGCFVNVCHAIAYAHSRGIIHRDLKPRNIMLGSYGEVLIIDWGLATIINEAEDDVDLASIKINESDGVVATRDGVIVGTPAYMAPEQAGGRRSWIDERTDIYGLGSVLFKILTGKPPHRGEETGNAVKDTMSLISRIAEDPSPRPEDVATGIPKALRAICAKAMARERSDRFQTGSELADEVSRWLADEPLACYRDSFPERVFRWLRRHRHWTQAITAALILVAVIATISALLIDAAREQEKVARENEAQARQEAIARLRDARTAVDKSLTGISDALTDFPGVESVRIELLKEAARDYERFASENSNDPDLRAESGIAWYRLAEVRRMLNLVNEAEDAYRNSIQRLDALVKEYPSNTEYRIQLATSQNLLAAWLTLLDGRLDEARSLFTTAEQELAPFVEADKIHVGAYEALTALLLNRAMLYTQTREYDSAELTLKKARSVLQTLIEHDPSEDHRRLLARTWWRTGRLQYQIGRHEKAIESLQTAADRFDELGRSNPNEPKNLEGLADAENDLGNALIESGHNLQAMAAFRRAIDSFQLLLDARPGVPAYLENVAIVQTNIAGLYVRNGHSRDAYDSCVEALKVLESLTSKYGEIRRFHEQRATCSTILGMISRDLNDDDFAMQALQAAAEEFSLLGEESPEFLEYRRRLAVAYTAQGRTLQKKSLPEAAAQQFSKSYSKLSELLQQDDADQVTRAALAWCCLQFGILKYEQGDHAGASEFFSRAKQERERLISDIPTAEHYHDYAYFLVHCPDPAFQDFGQAVERCDDAILLSDGNAKYRALKALALLRDDKPQRSVETALEAISQRGEFPHAADHFIIAMAYWKSNEPDAARTSLAAAIALMDDQQPGNLELIPLRQEAEGLISSGATSSEPPQN